MIKKITVFISKWWHSLFSIYMEDEHSSHVVYHRSKIKCTPYKRRRKDDSNYYEPDLDKYTFDEDLF
jgi:hypothetical protein